MDKKTKAFWSHGIAAKIYRIFAHKQFKPMHQYIIERYLARTGNKRVLDIACGPGDFLLAVHEQLPNVSLYGVDIAEGMLTHARKKLGEHAKFLQGDSTELSFETGAYDVITIMMAFHHFKNKLETLRHIEKWLANDGVIVIADVVACSDSQKKFWNLLERITGVRGHIEHYTEDDLREFAQNARLTFHSSSIAGMAKRYRICELRNIQI